MKFVFITDPHLSSTTPVSRIDNFTETSFKKMEYVLGVCKDIGAILLIGGDLFSTPTQPDWVKNRLKSLILQYGVKVISIPGNHDLLYYNVGYMERTSYQSLIAPEVIEDIEMFPNGAKVGDYTILAHRFGVEFPVVDSPNTIILSHCFYDYGMGDKLHVSKQEVFRSKAKFVCFGHDHNQYPLENNNGTIVVRPGALTRGTSHTENRVRVVSYALIDTEEEKVTYVPIPFALKFEEVFREKYEVKKDRVPVTFDEIQRFIDELRNAKLEVNPYDILYGLGRPQSIVNRCSYYLGAVGLVKE